MHLLKRLRRDGIRLCPAVAVWQTRRWHQHQRLKRLHAGKNLRVLNQHTVIAVAPCQHAERFIGLRAGRCDRLAVLRRRVNGKRLGVAVVIGQAKGQQARLFARLPPEKGNARPRDGQKRI